MSDDRGEKRSRGAHPSGAAALVSCIIPVFNGARYLAEAVESVLAQTHRPIEILIADDGSTDETPEVAAGFGDRVRYLRQENAGSPAARNLGLRHATGTFIGFLDSDDLWEPDKTERQLARFRERPELEFLVGHVQNFWVEAMADEEACFRDRPRGRPIPGYTTPALLARASLFERIGPFDDSLRHADSTEWFVRAERAGAIGELLPDVLVRRRMHERNQSRVRAENSREEFLRLIKARLDAGRRAADGEGAP